MLTMLFSYKFFLFKIERIIINIIFSHHKQSLHCNCTSNMSATVTRQICTKLFWHFKLLNSCICIILSLLGNSFIYIGCYWKTVSKIKNWLVKLIYPTCNNWRALIFYNTNLKNKNFLLGLLASANQINFNWDKSVFISKTSVHV